MGGFEGGDEGGFWDIDTLPDLIDTQNNRSKNINKTQSSIEINESEYRIKAHAKITIFLKVTGYKDELPTLLSRAVRVEELYDTISFVPCECDSFTIEGCDGIPLESNTIYKAYKALNDYTLDSDIEDFFNAHKVIVTKRIPLHSGLAGSSSDAAAFMHLIKEVCNLILSTDELMKIGRSINIDLPFFISHCSSANISGFGEIIEPFEEEGLNIEIYTPPIEYDKTLVYETFKQNLLSDMSLSASQNWEKMDSKSILKQIADPLKLNDLYPAALLTYPDLKKEAEKGWFFSGPTFFKLT